MHQKENEQQCLDDDVKGQCMQVKAELLLILVCELDLVARYLVWIGNTGCILIGMTRGLLSIVVIS